MKKIALPIVVILVFGSVFLAFGGGGKEAAGMDASKPYAGVTLYALLEGHPTDLAVAKLLPEFKEKTGIDARRAVTTMFSWTTGGTAGA